MVTSLGSFDDSIVAGDQISSVSLLKLVDDRLVSVARDYGPLYPVAVEALNKTTLIAANVSTLCYFVSYRIDDLLYRTPSMSYCFLSQKAYAEKYWKISALSIWPN